MQDPPEACDAPQQDAVRILQAHNYYRNPGGEDIVVAAEMDLLSVRGHQVELFSVSNESFGGVLGQSRVALDVHYSEGMRKRFSEEILRFRPDIVHVHNFFPLITPSIYDACLEHQVPVVQTLHNYRTICPVAVLLRDGKICEECVEGSAYKAALYGCYRGSRIGSLFVARMVEYHRKRGTWTSKVNLFIALTEFAKGKFIQGGLPKNKIVVKANFVDARNSENDLSQPRSGALFVGRLSPEKGIRLLVKAWEEIDYPLKVIGDGPMLPLLKAEDNRNISILGRKTREEIFSEMKRALFVVVPSEWYEGFPVVLVEAFAHELPAIVSRIGSLKEIVQDGLTGIHFTMGDPHDLTLKVKRAIHNPEGLRRMGKNAREVFKNRFSPDENYRMLMEIYNRAMSSRI